MLQGGTEENGKSTRKVENRMRLDEDRLGKDSDNASEESENETTEPSYSKNMIRKDNLKIMLKIEEEKTKRQMLKIEEKKAENLILENKIKQEKVIRAPVAKPEYDIITIDDVASYINKTYKKTKLKDDKISKADFLKNYEAYRKKKYGASCVKWKNLLDYAKELKYVYRATELAYQAEKQGCFIRLIQIN